MRNKMFAIAAVLLGLLCSPSFATDYTYNGTYYYNSAGQAYTRTQVLSYYWSNGCRYSRWTWQYTPVAGVYNVSSQTEGWRSKLLDIAGAHKRYQDQIAASANEHQEFLESVKELGLTNVVTNYGFAPQYANANSYMQTHGFSPGLNVQSYAQQQQVAPQGATLYGYREVADIYGNVNLGELYQRALRLREQSAGFEATATDNTNQLLDNLGARAAAIEELRAKADMMGKLVDGLKAESTAKVVREYYSTVKGGVPQPPQPGGAAAPPAEPNAQAAQVFEQLGAVIRTKCVSCHSGDKPNGGLDLTNLSKLNAKASRSILERIESADPVLRMPLAAGMKPGQPLSLDEKALFFIAAYGIAPPPQE